MHGLDYVPEPSEYLKKFQMGILFSQLIADIDMAAERLVPRTYDKAGLVPDGQQELSNLDLVAWVEDYLASHGIDSHRQYDETGEEASLFAHAGPLVEGGIVLSGHTDVVPIDGQNGTAILGK